jgi:hypothetical protein
MECTNTPYLLALTCVLVIVVVMMSSDIVMAVAIISSLVALALLMGAVPGAGAASGKVHSCDRGSCEGAESFETYPGAIAPDAETDSEGADVGLFGAAPAGDDSGEAATGDDSGAAATGDAGDDAADDAAAAEKQTPADGDRLMRRSALSRNDPTRVTAGTMRRRRDLDEYLREEVEAEEGRDWWGRDEE